MQFYDYDTVLTKNYGPIEKYIGQTIECLVINHIPNDNNYLCCYPKTQNFYVKIARSHDIQLGDIIGVRIQKTEVCGWLSLTYAVGFAVTKIDPTVCSPKSWAETWDIPLIRTLLTNAERLDHSAKTDSKNFEDHRLYPKFISFYHKGKETEFLLDHGDYHKEDFEKNRDYMISNIDTETPYNILILGFKVHSAQVKFLKAKHEVGNDNFVGVACVLNFEIPELFTALRIVQPEKPNRIASNDQFSECDSFRRPLSLPSNKTLSK